MSAYWLILDWENFRKKNSFCSTDVELQDMWHLKWSTWKPQARNTRRLVICLVWASSSTWWHWGKRLLRASRIIKYCKKTEIVKLILTKANIRNFLKHVKYFFYFRAGFYEETLSKRPKQENYSSWGVIASIFRIVGRFQIIHITT